ncbi:nuclear transport factor 2 family protein [Planotetraspora mira]|uniref:SnoaL-like domain-containing protein n=1 Tax=Planotetraspora mira TaxID=58121 RepID=A0A8J3U8Q3_9ACTN|nr:hypothetical protein Pmi06nite_80320 [Planotetraspora mira]
MNAERDLQYVLDRFAIQDLIAAYGLGQDLHQSGQDNDVSPSGRRSSPRTQSSTPVRSAGRAQSACGSMRSCCAGRGWTVPGGCPCLSTPWQHREGYASVGIDGDTATAVSPFLHLHQTRDGAANLLHAGMWHDRLARLPQGWRITHRCDPVRDRHVPPGLDEPTASPGRHRPRSALDEGSGALPWVGAVRAAAHAGSARSAT